MLPKGKIPVAKMITQGEVYLAIGGRRRKEEELR